ncbi:hypothetical protein HCB17_25745 [Salinispora arenicola]|uniref:hypothetical protein n=1 Tax=Salinispora arenicola TaxID=168697 RepID=UPI00143197D5|nr:hypothetical protein [Salinispora arenicola]NIL44135.1 hypothetical protein [Salinispora arenicola]
MELDLDDFAATVDARAPQLHNIGIQWQLHRGPTYNKSAAWIDCTNADLAGWLIVWTSGEAELETANLTTGSVDSTHYEFSALNDLTTCLDDLIRRLTPAARPLDRSHRDTPATMHEVVSADGRRWREPMWRVRGPARP